MKAKEFFNFLKIAPFEDIVKKKYEAQNFFPKDHYERFLELVELLESEEARKQIERINTFSYVIFKVRRPLIYDYFIIMYDIERDILYCDIIPRIVLFDKAEISSDSRVMKYLYRVPEDYIRVQGDLYIKFHRAASFQELLKYLVFKHILENIAEGLYKIFVSIIDNRIPEYRILYSIKEYTKYWIKEFQRKKLLNNSKYFLEFYRELTKTIFTIDALYMYNKTASYSTKLKNILKGLIKYEKYRYALNLILDSPSFLTEILPPIKTKSIPLYYIIDFQKQYYIIEILSKLRQLDLRLLDILNEISNIIGKYLCTKASFQNIIIKRRGGNPHIIRFIGISSKTLSTLFKIRRERNIFIALSDIIVEHPEHQKIRIPVNGYSPYINYKEMIKMEKEKITELPSALVSFILI